MEKKNKYIYEEDDYSYKEEQSYQLGKKEVHEYLQKVNQTTIGELTKRFMHLRDVLMDILDDLKIEEKAYYDQTSPPPTTVKLAKPKKKKPERSAKERYRDWSMISPVPPSNYVRRGKPAKRGKSYLLS